MVESIKVKYNKLNMTKMLILPLAFLILYQSTVKNAVYAQAEVASQQHSNHSNELYVNEKYLDNDFYIIGPGDKLELKIFDVPELSCNLDVLNDGSVSLPLIGTVQLSGLTLQEAIVQTRNLLSAELLRPNLQISIVKPRPIRVSLVGQVERPGIYSLSINEDLQTAGSPTTSVRGLPTVVDAIQKAGGITQVANLRDVTLKRRLPGKTHQYKQASLNLIELIVGGNHVNNPFLFDGDIIHLKKAKDIPMGAMEIASVNLSPQLINVNVIGEVENPGGLQLKANTPLVQAVLAAGGPKAWRANVGNVELVRINRNGSATLESFKIDLNQGASNTKNPPLRDGDILRVSRSSLAKTSDAINAVSQPVTGLVTIWTLLQLVKDFSN